MMLLHMEIAEQTADWRGTRLQRYEMLRQTSEGGPGFRKRETDSQTELWRQAGNDEQREAN